MAINFADVASKKLEDIERPPLPPVGTYHWRITKLPDQTTSKDGKWDIVNFPVICVGFEDDVDAENYPGDLMKYIQSVRFMFDKTDQVAFDNTLNRLKTFLIKHAKAGDESQALNECINNSINCVFMAAITWNQDKQDADVMHANLGRTAPME